jgi:hypothetical protein
MLEVATYLKTLATTAIITVMPNRCHPDWSLTPPAKPRIWESQPFESGVKIFPVASDRDFSGPGAY